MRLKVIAQLVLLNVGVLLASCSGSDSTSTGAAFENRAHYVWRLESYGNDENNLTTANLAADFKLQFNRSSDGFVTSFSGYDGCNTFGADVVSAEPGHFQVVNPIAQDGQFCDELQSSEYVAQHDYLYALLESYFSYEFNQDERMRLRTEDNKLIVFARCGLVDEQVLSQECLL